MIYLKWRLSGGAHGTGPEGHIADSGGHAEAGWAVDGDGTNRTALQIAGVNFKRRDSHIYCPNSCSMPTPIRSCWPLTTAP